MTPFEDLEKANNLYKEQQFAQAAQAYSKIATELYIRNEDSNLGEIAMKLAIDSYRNTLNPLLLQHIVKNANGNLLLQFFSIRCYLEDHLIEKDEAKINRSIHRHIPPKLPERIFEFEGKIIPTAPNKIISSSSRIGPYQAATFSAQGPREKMEDFFLSAELNLENSLKIPFFAILDGHGGIQCARFVKNQIKKHLTNHLKTEDDLSIYNSIHQVCITLDDNWKEYVFRPSAKTRDHSGTTLLFALIINGALWVVSVGDSRAVLGENGEAIQLSEDAKPTVEKYLLEILKRGGDVRWRRVDGSLDMARSIGDIEHPSVSARPCIRKFDLSVLDKTKTNLLVLATDGLWDVIGSSKAIELCQNFKSPKSMAAELVSAAYNNGSLDNVTVMVVLLK